MEDHYLRELREWNTTFVTETSVETKTSTHALSGMFETGRGRKQAIELANSERASWQLSH